MEQINQVQAQQIWQRVRAAGASAPRDTLETLIREERELAAVYLRLSRKFTGREYAVLRRMFEQEQSHCSCLRGIYTLTTGKKPECAASKPAHGSVEQVLRECYGREMRALSAYEARSADPQYGHVFAELKTQDQDHCRIILQLIGSLPGKGTDSDL